MECPKCGKEKHKTNDTWSRWKEIDGKDGKMRIHVIKRAKCCKNCDYSFTTTEEIDEWYPPAEEIKPISLKTNGHNHT